MYFLLFYAPFLIHIFNATFNHEGEVKDINDFLSIFNDFKELLGGKNSF